ncbi:MAG: MATE family efflux transporter [Ruminococcus sp.]|uniref:MATE family efflux transporter n=1 Tax=Ruminococcus sp. TaxID=41978 RepID=UPI001B2E6F27|nr:MATE family efflux transporter [Ruminococcus sp.]MBO7472683.1 MATE family efflux transporter [Ruminococcus sp.]MBP5432578.1 MATE family efflux transporter [Ruminococcus sp.]
MAKANDLTNGSVTALILRFYFPMLLTNMLQQMYSIVDTAIVGKGLGDTALAAVGNIGPLTFLIFGFSMGLANGFSVVIAQSFGAKNYSKLRRSVASSFLLCMMIAVILTALSVSFLKSVLHIMRTDQLIMQDGLIYGYCIFGGLTATIAYNLCSCILRALGDSKTPFIAIIISTTVNIILDTFFIFVLKTGVEGAAAATIISQIVSSFICWRKIRKIDVLEINSNDFHGNGKLYIELFKNGLPMALMNSITAVGCMVIQYFINGLGVAYTTAYSACSKFTTLFMQPACTSGFAMSAFTSQNYGAGKFSRIREGLHVCLAIATISYVILGSLMVFFPTRLAGIMVSGSEPISIAKTYLPICGICLIGVNYLFVFRNGCQGFGKPLVPMISGVLEMALRIGVIALLIPIVGFRATAYAEASAWIGAMILNMLAFEYNLKKNLSRPAIKHKKIINAA